MHVVRRGVVPQRCRAHQAIHRDRTRRPDDVVRVDAVRRQQHVLEAFAGGSRAFRMFTAEDLQARVRGLGGVPAPQLGDRLGHQVPEVTRVVVAEEVVGAREVLVREHRPRSRPSEPFVLVAQPGGDGVIGEMPPEGVRQDRPPVDGDRGRGQRHPAVVPPDPDLRVGELVREGRIGSRSDVGHRGTLDRPRRQGSQLGDLQLGLPGVQQLDGAGIPDLEQVRPVLLQQNHPAGDLDPARRPSVLPPSLAGAPVDRATWNPPASSTSRSLLPRGTRGDRSAIQTSPRSRWRKSRSKARSCASPTDGRASTTSSPDPEYAESRSSISSKLSPTISLTSTPAGTTSQMRSSATRSGLPAMTTT